MEMEEMIEAFKPFFEKAGVPVPEDMHDLSIEQLCDVMGAMVRDPHNLEGLSVEELEALREETEEQIDELEDKLSAIEDRLDELEDEDEEDIDDDDGLKMTVKFTIK